MVLMMSLGSCSFFSQIGAEDPLLREFPEEVLPVPNAASVPEEIFDHEAVDINESETIIGYANSSGPYVTEASAYDEFPARGFAIQADGSGYVDISADSDGSHASWPLDLSDAGVVVGAYLNGDTGTIHAYRISADGTDFLDLHPDGETSSQATHVDETGRIFGVVGAPPASQAVEFASDGSGATELAPTYDYSTVQAISDAYVVIHAETESPTEGEAPEGVLLLYSIASDNHQLLAIPGVDSDTAQVESIKDDGRLVGWFVSLPEPGEPDPEYLGDVAYAYTLGETESELYQPTIPAGDWEFIEYRFIDFADDGTIVGVGFRLETGGIVPQARAITVSWDETGISGFTDISPPNGETYAEARAITENGRVTGYAGFSFRDLIGRYTTTRNRGFALLLQ